MIVGLSVAFLVSFGLSGIQIPIHHICAYRFCYRFFLAILGFQVGFKKREEFIHAVQSTKNAGLKKKEAEEAASRNKW